MSIKPVVVQSEKLEYPTDLPLLRFGCCRAHDCQSHTHSFNSISNSNNHTRAAIRNQWLQCNLFQKDSLTDKCKINKYNLKHCCTVVHKLWATSNLECVASSSHGSTWAEHFGGSVPCSRVPSQCPEGVLAPPLSSGASQVFLSTSQPSLLSII